MRTPLLTSLVCKVIKLYKFTSTPRSGYVLLSGIYNTSQKRSANTAEHQSADVSKLHIQSTK
jgi:hypothetical protein